MSKSNEPQYPFYVVSRSRADTRLTDKALTGLGVPHYTVVEEDQFDMYARVVPEDQILVVPQRFHDQYDTFDTLGQSKSQGPGPARNFCWEHSIRNGYERHWVFDDNVRAFYRMNNNFRVYVKDGTMFRCMEDFVNRYENVALAGPNYVLFAPDRQKHPPFIANTRIYSMLLIMNKIPYRWRGRYNEDTDLSLRALKDGWCTIQFNAFLGNKIGTQTVPGGNSAEFYDKEGTLPKSEMQVKMHPDVSKLVWRFSRIHHYVDYTPFKKNRLIRKAGVEIPKGVNNYGMVLRPYPKDDKKGGKKGGKKNE